MIGLKMGSSSFFNQQSSHGIMDGVEAADSISSSASSEVVSVESSDDEATYSLSPSPPASATSPLHDLSSLMTQLPLKRGLSKHFQGKSQSFTSLANVRCLEDLAKPEIPCNKKLKLKSCKSYGGGLSSSHLPRTNSTSKFIPKKASNSRVSCSSLSAKRTPSFIGNKSLSPPPHRSTSTTSISSHNPSFG